MQAANSKKEICFFKLFDRFILDCQKGKRLQPNGKKISQGTIHNYGYTRQLLQAFSETKGFALRIRPVRYLHTRQLEAEKNYWKKFYKRFTDYLYIDCGHYDNYVGQTVKNIRIFFNWLNKDLALGVGDFHKQFYVRKEEIAIFPLSPEELNFLVSNEPFHEKLLPRMREVKDFFVFGCTVALRVSDLLSLRSSNVRIINNQHYLVVRSIKTNTDTLVKLPAYAVEIIRKYRKRKMLLPSFNKTNLNRYIKMLMEQAGFIHPVEVKRERRGIPLLLGQKFRFCDVASTHTMRRTAITTMLSLGMPEQVVRKISGHAPGSREFYRYVLWAQTYQDQETEQMFEKLQQKTLAVSF